MELEKLQTMTSLQIAEVTEKPHYDVLKAIRNMEPAWEKVNGGKFSCVEYIDAKGEKRPMYSLSKTECLYIATKFNDEARARLVVRWEQLETEKPKPLSQLEILQQSVNMLVEQERRLNTVENKISMLEAKTATRPDYFTIVGYGLLHHITVSQTQSSSLGKMATAICRMRGLPIDKTTDARWGKVNMYPKEVLNETFKFLK